jgi:hypothetical protein
LVAVTNPNHIRSTDGEVLHYDHKTFKATAVNHEDDELLTFMSYDFYSGWPVRTPRKGDKIRIHWGSDGFLAARLKPEE